MSRRGRKHTHHCEEPEEPTSAQAERPAHAARREVDGEANRRRLLRKAEVAEPAIGNRAGSPRACGTQQDGDAPAETTAGAISAEQESSDPRSAATPAATQRDALAISRV